ncbi:hypothetical protein ABN702_09105 [Bacillus haimaensis]|uniref:hypothetical protein n=1 Tax=Bacillus haimaensis TaxID=3160967 RepID=UPI003AA80809
MELNSYVIRLSLMIIGIFGGVFLFRYIKNGELLLDQLIGVTVGVLLLVVAVIWRRTNQTSSSAN